MPTFPKAVAIRAFTAEFKGVPITVLLMRAQTGSAPFYRFLVTMGKEQFFINKSRADNDTWIAGTISHPDALLLGLILEEKLGHPIPYETNNPFEYTGEIAVTIERIYLKGLQLLRVKAPFNEDRYYRIETKVALIEIMKSFSFSEEGQWYLTTNNLSPERFTQITEMIDACEAITKDYPLQSY